MLTTDEISTFLAKKRTAGGERLQWANHIIERSLQLIEEKGNFADVHGTEIRPKTVTHKSLSILYSTPFNRLESIPGEVFSTCLIFGIEMTGKYSRYAGNLLKL